MTNKAKKRIELTERIKEFLSQNWRICIYTLCGLGLCWIDLWRGIGNGAQWALAVNCTGFCILPLILFRLDWKIILPNKCENEEWHNRLRICFYGWIALFVVLAYPSFKHFAPGTDYDAQIATAVANVGLYGAIAIRMYFYLFHEKKENESTSASGYKITWVFWLWLAFIVLAIISVNESIWPLWFMVMFGSFYLAPIKKEDMEELVEGLVNGLIIGFFWIQSRAFLYRPYDLGPRYRGHYTNANVNAMFYLFTYVAWLAKLTVYRIRKYPIRYVITFFMSASMWSFVFLTGSRSALLGLLGVSLVYWGIESRYIGKNRFWTFVSKEALMLMCASLSFMPVFLCARYIPPLRHHPIWYGSEYCDESIMSWDPIDSPKYMELDTILQENLGRFYSIPKALIHISDASTVDATTRNYASPVCSYRAVASTTDSAENIHALDSHFGQNQYSDDGDEIYWYDDGVIPGSDVSHPVFVKKDYSSGALRRLLNTRYYIYRYILENIHILGNAQISMKVWIFGDFPLYHAHNTVLQMMYWFGAMPGLLFLFLMASVIVISIMRIHKNRYDGLSILPISVFLLFMLGYALTGLFECIAFPGENGLTLFFMAFLPTVRLISE